MGPRSRSSSHFPFSLNYVSFSAGLLVARGPGAHNTIATFLPFAINCQSMREGVLQVTMGHMCSK